MQPFFSISRMDMIRSALERFNRIFFENSSIKSLKAPERKMAPFFQICDDEFQ